MKRIILAGLVLAPASAQPVSAWAETLYVSNERGNSVTVIDAASAKVVATWAVGAGRAGSPCRRTGNISICAHRPTMPCR